MATCEICGKKTVFGHNRSFSMRATNRKFRANLQKVTLFESGKKTRKTVCTRCLRTMAKS
ncbi:MAG: 50S ribosomal protein L28 [Anaerolineae bacterium]|nr:50S ribosomal protein L28 [Anaerolineae bacterium]